MPEEQLNNPGLQKLVLGKLHSPYEQRDSNVECPFSRVPLTR